MSSKTLVIGTDGSFRRHIFPTVWSSAYHCISDGRERFVGGFGGSSNRAELIAVLIVLQDFPDDNLHILSDSMGAVNGINVYSQEWENRNWLKVGNAKQLVNHADIYKQIRELIKDRERRGLHTHIRWVRGHDLSRANRKANALARSYSRELMSQL